ncbi:MAG: F0F1 ATP synthase subunit delta [Bacteroidetes bacterium]|uniref:ATP synthase subunit delta n=1 Tax=Candidatus Cryptobacteroides faecigallinarum TaxID=2840763 RepID=A0A9D9ING7_9BACT|nr:F0F1 ATP synthase subunit delta [Candidatus Cryptobacteroides faecigallinarum]
MDIGLISRRYAKALADYSAERGEDSKVYGEVQQLAELYRQDRPLHEALQSPVLPIKEKISALCHLSPAPLCKSLTDFISLVLRHHRENLLYFMFHSFMDLYRERHNIREAELYTAAPVGNGVEETLRSKIQELSGYTVNLHRKIKPAIIGGFVFRMDDMLIDASVASQLAVLRRNLGNEPARKI